MTNSKRLTEPLRLEAVQASGLLDSPPEPEFDRLTRLAAQLLDAPAAFVTVISGDRQYLKSAVADGERSEQAGSSTELDRSFCQHAISSNEPFVVQDAREHPLVKDNKAVAEGVIAYAGIPLHTHDGESIGALCVVDSKPRQWSGEDVENLRALARAAMQLIDERGRLPSSEPTEKLAHTTALIDCVANHFRAADAYSEIVAGAGALDLKTEQQARERLTRSLAELHDSYAQHRAGATRAQPVLAAALEKYLEADRQREQTARAFGQGKADLNSLEGAIRQNMDASDALRIAAIDHGAEL